MFTFIVCPNCPPNPPTDKFKPGTVPCNDWPKLLTGRESSTLVSTVATASVRLAFLCVPKPTTTTSSNVCVSSDIWMLYEDWFSLTLISCVMYPMKEITNTFSFETCNVKFPSRSVTVPLVVPLTMTLAPIIGSLSFLSVTTPVMLNCCAYRNVQLQSNIKNRIEIFFMLLCFLIRH